MPAHAGKEGVLMKYSKKRVYARNSVIYRGSGKRDACANHNG